MLCGGFCTCVHTGHQSLSSRVVSPAGCGIWAVLAAQNVLQVFRALQLPGGVSERSGFILKSSAEWTSEAVRPARLPTADSVSFPVSSAQTSCFSGSVSASSVLLVVVLSLRSPRLLERSLAAPSQPSPLLWIRQRRPHLAPDGRNRRPSSRSVLSGTGSPCVEELCFALSSSTSLVSAVPFVMSFPLVTVV